MLLVKKSIHKCKPTPPKHKVSPKLSPRLNKYRDDHHLAIEKALFKSNFSNKKLEEKKLSLEKSS